MFMINWKILCLFAVSIAVFTAGCNHVQVATQPFPANAKEQNGFKPLAYGTARNCGYYLFNVIPLHTGHPRHPNRKQYHAFHDDIRPAVNANILQNEMRRLYKADQLVNVKHTESSWGYFSLWLVWRKAITTTAIGVKDVSGPKDDKGGSEEKK